MKKNICTHIEDLMIKQAADHKKNERESKEIEQHIIHCSSCRSYKIRLESLENVMQSVSEPDLQSDPAIRRNLIHRMRQIHQSKKSQPDGIIDSIISVLNFRIPVYQAVLAAAFLIFIFMAGINNRERNIQESDLNSSDIQRNLTLMETEYVIPSPPELEKQKVGINVNEDSVLTGYLYTLM